MRVIAVAAITADGMIARRPDEFADWTPTEDKKLFASIARQAGVIVMGRRTFETIGRPLPKRLNLIVTSQPAVHTPTPDLLEYTDASPAEILANLEARGFSEVVIAGGATVYRQFIGAGLVDELWLTVAPLLFGGGVSLLGAGELVNVEMRLLSCEQLTADVIHLRYALRSAQRNDTQPSA